MTINTFWALLLKGIGISLAFSILSIISGVIMSFTHQSFNVAFVLPTAPIITPILIFLICFLIIKLLLFNTQWVIEKLKLDKGFKEDRIDINITPGSFIRIIIILISTYIFSETIIIFCKDLFVIIVQKHFYSQAPLTGWLLFYGIKAVICFIILSNNKYLAGLIDKQTSTSEIVEIQE